MAIKQLSVFLENRPGKLLGTVKKLADAGVNIRAMSIADTKEFGLLRLIVDDPDKAKAALNESAIITVTEVVAVEMPDKSGALAEILGILSETGINIEYMYAFTAPVDAGAYVVLRVADNAGAEATLRSKGIRVLDRLNA